MDSHKTHPAADVLPLLTGQEFEDLVLDIRARGLLHPIVLHPDGSLLDGRNRERACARAGVDPRYVVWDGATGMEADYVVSVNLKRRHLSVADRAAAAAKIANLKQGDNQHRPNGPTSAPAPVTVAEAARMFDVSERSVKRARAAEREEMEPQEKRDRRGRRLPDAETLRPKHDRMRERQAHVNDMMTALGILSSLPDPADLVSTIKAGQRTAFNRQLPIAIDWLRQMQETWNEYIDK